MKQKNRTEAEKNFYLYVHRNNNPLFFQSTNLKEIKRLKHNYKSSKHFKTAFISPIFDDKKDMPLIFQSNITRKKMI